MRKKMQIYDVSVLSHQTDIYIGSRHPGDIIEPDISMYLWVTQYMAPYVEMYRRYYCVYCMFKSLLICSVQSKSKTEQQYH